MQIIPPLDRIPWCVRFVQRPAGKAALLLLFAAALLAHQLNGWMDVAVALTILVAFPRWRAALLTASTAYFLVRHPSWLHLSSLARLGGAGPGAGGWAAAPVFQMGMVVIVLTLAALAVRYVQRHPRSWAAQRSVFLLILTTVGLFAAAVAARGAGPIAVVLFAAALVLGAYMRFIGYSLIAPPITSRREWLLHAASLHPMWISQGINPMPRGGTELARVESSNEDELAVTQLKGLKLVYWALSLLAFEWLVRLLLYGELPGRLRFLLVHLPAWPHVPHLDDALARSVAGHPYPWYVGWLVVVSTFVIHVIEVARGSHIVVSIIRLAGFRALRGVVRPFAATSFADFWGRYSFYFKEVLATFFFIPTYRRWFRGHPRLRVIAASFAAAGLGNYLFHVMVFCYRSVPLIDAAGLWAVLSLTGPILVYSLVLSAGIAGSHLWALGHRATEVPAWRRAATSARIVVLYALMWVLPLRDTNNFALAQYLRFYASLF